MRRPAVCDDGPGLTLSVLFADLVFFTALSQQLSEHALASVVSRFEELAYDVVAARGGRVAKMIGDEAMFVVDDVRQAADVALDLSAAYAEEEELSNVRVGLAYGRVLAREGDYFGPVVNLASRIVGIARPATVVVSDVVHDALADDGAFEWRPLRFRYLKDIGRVQLWVISRPEPVEEGEDTGPLADARRQGRRAVRTLLREQARERIEQRHDERRRPQR
jgi:adenylate cyclase